MWARTIQDIDTDGAVWAREVEDIDIERPLWARGTEYIDTDGPGWARGDDTAGLLSARQEFSSPATLYDQLFNLRTWNEFGR